MHVSSLLQGYWCYYPCSHSQRNVELQPTAPQPQSLLSTWKKKKTLCRQDIEQFFFVGGGFNFVSTFILGVEKNFTDTKEFEIARWRINEERSIGLYLCIHACSWRFVALVTAALDFNRRERKPSSWSRSLLHTFQDYMRVSCEAIHDKKPCAKS